MKGLMWPRIICLRNSGAVGIMSLRREVLNEKLSAGWNFGERGNTASMHTSELTTILRTLKGKRDDFISLAGLGETTGLSRQEIIGGIEKMESQGYEIEIHPSLGARLLSVPDTVLPHEIYTEMEDMNWFGAPICVIYRDEINSTNELGKLLARQGARDGTVIISEFQSKGKGRQGRKWISPPGKNLLFSLILRPKLEAYRLPFLTILASTAVAAALREEYGLSVGVKWPNDLVLEGKKLGGILTEGEGLEGNVHFAVIGIGLNVNVDSGEMPQDIAQNAISLDMALGYTLHRAHVLAAILKRMKQYYAHILNGTPEIVIETWKSLSDTIGKYVELTGGVTGYAEDIDQEGALILRSENGIRRRIWVGDLTQLF